MKSKKAEEQLMSFWMFVAWGLIGLTIVGAVYLFYSTEVDVRDTHSLVLANRVVDCLVDSGELNSAFFNEDFDLFSICDLNEDSFEDNFYISVNVISDNPKEINFGNPSFVTDCEISEIGDAKKYPRCEFHRMNIFYFLDDKKNKGIIEVFSGAKIIGRGI
jgi:hypothetical protein